MEGNKRCGKCGEMKPLTAYYTRGDSDAPRSVCKRCYLKLGRIYDRQTNTRFIRRANKLNSRFPDGIKLTPKQIKSLLSKPCYHCGSPAKHIDHIIPVSKGGEHRLGNLGPMCADCNLRKGSKFYGQFRYEL